MDDMSVLAWEEQNLPSIASVVELNTIVSSVPKLRRSKGQRYGLKSLAEKLSPSRGAVQKDKSITVSDWGLPLSNDHIVYAATDAWLGVELAHLVVERMLAKSADHRKKNDACTITLKDLHPQRVFETYLGLRGWDSMVRSISSATQYSISPNGKPQNARVHRKPRSMVQIEGLEEKLYQFVANEESPMCTIHGVLDPRIRYKIHSTIDHYHNLFSFSYVSSKDPTVKTAVKSHWKSKSIVIIRQYGKNVAELNTAIKSVEEFSELVWKSNEEQKISIRIIRGGWALDQDSAYIDYQGPFGVAAVEKDEKARHISECLVDYTANTILQRMYKTSGYSKESGYSMRKFQIQCKRNAENPRIMDLWSECIQSRTSTAV
jgi:hypothetical protein